MESDLNGKIVWLASSIMCFIGFILLLAYNYYKYSKGKIEGTIPSDQPWLWECDMPLFHLIFAVTVLGPITIVILILVGLWKISAASIRWMARNSTTVNTKVDTNKRHAHDNVDSKFEML